jgi:hypothetical protein
MTCHGIGKVIQSIWTDDSSSEIIEEHGWIGIFLTKRVRDFGWHGITNYVVNQIPPLVLTGYVIIGK